MKIVKLKNEEQKMGRISEILIRWTNKLKSRKLHMKFLTTN